MERKCQTSRFAFPIRQRLHYNSGMNLLRTLALSSLFTCLPYAAEPSLPPGVVNTQNPSDRPLSPQESLARITMPEGFQATLFAGEPDVYQPIAFDFDDRGRLWVVECFSYPDYKVEGRDRILIFTDRDGDGRFDERKVFIENGKRLSGIAIGFGGVWVTGPPNLLFYPDADGNDVPDAEPEVLLDGWTLNAAHNKVNGLAWGPDGWLYGRHGITTWSMVGKPGAPAGQRRKFSCAIWRYHPVRKTFEVVLEGTTNPWGLDWDDMGQAFFSNNVLPHMWHMIPGAHYRRMFGEDFNRYAYGLMETCADHLHWAGGDWTQSRTGHGAHGGGHSHSGAMIYLGGAFPAEYRNRIFMSNIHGNRVLYDHLERKGSGYVAKHGTNFLMANDAWFRGVTVSYGPDGGVFVSDWNDLGECHDTDGSYRSSGRIYKVTYGNARLVVAEFDLQKLADAELVKLQLHTNDWYVRHSRRILQERAAAGTLAAETEQALVAILKTNPDVTRRLRALWVLHGIGASTREIPVSGPQPQRVLQAQNPRRAATPVTTSIASELLGDADENVRWWAIQLLAESGNLSARDLQQFNSMARDDQSPMVRLALASALQRLPVQHRWTIAQHLVGHAQDAGDANLPLMYWYAIEPMVPADPARVMHLATASKIPTVREYIARRLAEMHE